MTNRERRPDIHPLAVGLPTDGREIERLSHRMIDEKISEMNVDPSISPIARRVIHATADFSFGESIRVHQEAFHRAKEAIAARRPIICDVRMVQVGITKTGCETICAINDPEVLRYAKMVRSTRSAAAMEILADRMDGAIVAIGNAPTALWKVIEMAAAGKVNPAVVVGLPVGFVGAAESKEALVQSELCYISNVGPRGGSPVAAAAVNALALEAANNN